MPTIVRQFTGNLNRDASPYRTPSEDYLHAFNIARDSEGELSDGPPTSIPGNKLVPYTLPAGVCKVIGGYPDTLTNKYYYIVWNENGNHCVYYYWGIAGYIVKVFENLTDSGDIDIFPLNLSFRISSINILRRDEGDILYFVDGLTRPYKMNVNKLIFGLYGIVAEETIRTARMPPLNALSPLYGTDPTVKVNNFKRKLFQFIYRWVYQDGEKSTWSPISKTVLPTGAYSIDTESDPTENNFISLLLTGGPQDYKAIEIGARESQGIVWGDFFLVGTVDRVDDSVSPGGSYNYIFFNDGAYPFLDQAETDLLFDRIPNIAQTQELANGNVLLFANITDGYPQIPRTEISVQITSELKDTEGNTTTPVSPELTAYLDTGGDDLYFKIGSSVSEGCFYRIKFDITQSSSATIIKSIDVNHTATVGQDAAAVAAALITKLNTQLTAAPNPPTFTAVFQPGDPYQIKIHLRWSIIAYTARNIQTSAQPPAIVQGGDATWKWNAKYRLGLVYFDKYSKTNGVISFVTNDSDVTDFAVTTPDFDFNATTNNPKIPIIKASINHLPPSWAVSYCWVRTPNLTVSSFLQYVTCDAQTLGDYVYLCIENLTIFKEKNTGFVPSYTFASGDRVRVYATVNDPGYVLETPVRDYEILGTIRMDMTGASTTEGLFIKVAAPTGGITYAQKTMIEIYRPATRTTEQGQVFYEFGETYPIYTLDGANYHIGGVQPGNQNQTGSQPATFTFNDGDVYYKFRSFYGLGGTGAVDPSTVYSRGIMDANYSDYYSSAVNSNGRPNIIDPNAKTSTNQTLIRFGGAYQQGTDVNLINRFYEENFDEYDKNYGGVLRLHIRDRLMHVYQKTKVGKVPIYGQIVKDQSGGDQVLISDKLINPIQYYAGDYGIGDCPESLAWNNFTDYFVDDLRGVVCKLGQQGIEPISITKNMNSFFVQNLKNYREGLNNGYSPGLYMGNPTVIGAFDAYTNKYILAMEEISRYDETGTQIYFQSANTVAYNERSAGFESFYSYHPDWVSCLDTLLLSFKNGSLWTHNGEFSNVFYETGSESSITVVLNDTITDKKTWNNITEQGNVVWACPEISTSLNSPVGDKQISNLVIADFADYEGEFNAAFLRETNSIGGIGDGDVLKGNYMIIKLQATPQNFSVFLNRIEVDYKLSPKNNRQ